MAVEQLSNNASTTITAGLTNVVTTVPVAANASFPATGQFRILIDNELMLVTAGAGTNSWTVTRGIEGSTNVAHSNGAAVFHVLTAGGVANLQNNFWTAMGVAGISPLGTGRFVGYNASAGGPATGTWLLSDFCFDVNGHFWTCSAAGTPGTWISPYAWGTMGYVESGTNTQTSASTTPVDLTSMTLTVTPQAAGRRIRISGHLEASSTVAADVMCVRLYEGATLLGQGQQDMGAATHVNSCEVFGYAQPTVAAHTYKMSFLRASGTGTITITTAAARPLFLVVEDIGT